MGWNRWGRPVDRPQSASSTGDIVAAPTLEELMPLQPLSHVLSTAHLQTRGSRRAAQANAPDPRNGNRISGTAVRFDEAYEVGGFKELVKRGAFKESLALDDPRCLFNSDLGRVLGRQSAQTLRLSETPDGLEFEVDTPDTSWARDLMVSMRRKDIDGAGVAFMIAGHRWEQRGQDRVRVVEKARLVFVSVEAFGAAGRAQADIEEEIKTAQRVGYAQGVLAAKKELAMASRIKRALRSR